MKHSRVFLATLPLATVLLTANLTALSTFANSAIAGGYVPEKRNLIIFPQRGASSSDPGRPVEVALIEIDNNLPSYDLVLDFSGMNDRSGEIAEVRLEGAGGILGRGLDDPSGSPLAAEAGTGRFVWSPGRQETATIRYLVRVMVTYRSAAADRPSMSVSLNTTY